ncbi:MAG: 3-oxoacyl-[acyl-carrier-protein] reductase [Candidatus Aminicenantes bacterium RBG_19FT_COMBO_58_17]|jgi:3-oxoacyl-[acyl-carrier protein] reductase|nr:MAG: 3-oxoacyl-[acyl-carrier-protein] reductase [Candidatus Aminicenantes bacterium RBG_19FT_COMBO_58_17]
MEAKPNPTFSGRIALVTGASQGIGETIAFELAKEGPLVVLVDIQREKLEAVAERIARSGGRASVQTADVSRFDQAAAVVEGVVGEHRRLDYLVNNAGITRDNLLMRMREEEWDAVLAVNLKGVFNFCRAAIRPMISSRFGRIVNISSVVGVMGNAGQANYSASKAGVIGLTKSLAREVAGREVTVNCVAPGYIMTAMTESLPEAVKKAFLEMIPMKRMGTPEDVAQAVKFLLSDQAAYITGQVIHVNGGMYT